MERVGCLLTVWGIQVFVECLCGVSDSFQWLIPGRSGASVEEEADKPVVNGLRRRALAGCCE